MRKIEVTVGPDGEVTIEAIGFKGGACAKATAALEAAMGGKPTKKIKKPEFDQATTQGCGV